MLACITHVKGGWGAWSWVRGVRGVEGAADRGLRGVGGVLKGWIEGSGGVRTAGASGKSGRWVRAAVNGHYEGRFANWRCKHFMRRRTV